MVSEQIVYAITWVSWSSVIAGAVTAIAVSIVMAVLGIALGFTVVKPQSDDPVHGLGMTFSIWSFVSVLVSMGAGGFIGGLFAGQRGLEHGFLVWAVVLIVATCFSSVAVGAAARMIGSAVRTLGSGAATAAGAAASAGKSIIDATGDAVSEIKENVDLNVDMNAISENVTNVLRDTGVDALQPEYIQQQMREARSNLRQALRKLSLQPSNYDQIISNFMETEKKRLDGLTKAVDKDAAVNALVKNRNIPEQEAEQMVDNALMVYQQAAQKAKDSLAEAKDQARDAKQYMKEMIDQARVKADRIASSAAKAAFAAAAALVLAGALSMGAGFCGVNYAADTSMLQSTYIIR